MRCRHWCWKAESISEIWSLELETPCLTLWNTVIWWCQPPSHWFWAPYSEEASSKLLDFWGLGVWPKNSLLITYFPEGHRRQYLPAPQEWKVSLRAFSAWLILDCLTLVLNGFCLVAWRQESKWKINPNRCVYLILPWTCQYPLVSLLISYVLPHTTSDT